MTSEELCASVMRRIREKAVQTLFYISNRKENLQMEAIKALLGQTYWAQNRTEDLIRCSIEHSECYGVYLKDTNRQIGFARVVTDYVGVFYLCDVIVDRDYRGMGVGKALIEAIVSDQRFVHLRGLLATSNAHEFYKKFGFRTVSEKFMCREP